MQNINEQYTNRVVPDMAVCEREMETGLIEVTGFLIDRETGVPKGEPLRWPQPEGWYTPNVTALVYDERYFTFENPQPTHRRDIDLGDINGKSLTADEAHLLTLVLRRAEEFARMTEPEAREPEAAA
jgi:hypothetical protein